MADARYKLKYGVSPVQMALSTLSKTKVDKSKLTQLLTSVLEGNVVIQFLNDPRTSNGCDHMQVLREYFQFADEDTATWTSWWKNNGRHAVQLVQQAYLNDRHISTANTSLIQVASPSFNRSPSLFPTSGVLNVPGITLKTINTSDVGFYRPSVSTSSHPTPVLRDTTADTNTTILEVDMRQNVLRMVSKSTDSCFKGTSRATRDLNRQPFGPRSSCLVQFGRGIFKYKKLKRHSQSQLGLSAPELMTCFEADEIPVGYNPPFDRNDLMFTNRNALDGINIQPVALVLIECGRVPLYMTWCLESDIEGFMNNVCSGTIVCNASVTGVRSSVTAVREMYPSDTFYSDEVLVMLDLLENEIELQRTLRPPKGCNQTIPHATHLHLFQAGSCHNANVRRLRICNEVTSSLKELCMGVDAYDALFQTLPLLVFTIVSSGCGDYGLSQRCIYAFFEKASVLKTSFTETQNRCFRLLTQFGDIDKQRREAVERAWVHAQITPGVEIGVTFQSMTTESNTRPLFYIESYREMTLQTTRMDTSERNAKLWSSLRDMQWCFAAQTLGMWIVEQPIQPPPLIEQTTLQQIKNARGIVIRSCHPDKNKNSDANNHSAKVGNAFEYMIHVITLVN